MLQGEAYHTDKGDIFVKHNKQDGAYEMFHGELCSLNILKQTQTIRVPTPLCIVQDGRQKSAIVMEYLEMGRVSEWKKLASDLASLHLFNTTLKRMQDKRDSWVGRKPMRSNKLQLEHDLVINKQLKCKINEELLEEVDYVEEFGFPTTTCCGLLPLSNEWHSNWIEFYARQRLNVQIQMLTDKTGDRELIELWSELQLKVDRFFSDIPEDNLKPSLLHGDLWSGNVAQIEVESNECDDDGKQTTTKQKIPVVFDPSTFYGHDEFDLAIGELFGGFHKEFYKEYFYAIPMKRGYVL